MLFIIIIIFLLLLLLLLLIIIIIILFLVLQKLSNVVFKSYANTNSRHLYYSYPKRCWAQPMATRREAKISTYFWEGLKQNEIAKEEEDMNYTSLHHLHFLSPPPSHYHLTSPNYSLLPNTNANHAE